MALQDRYPLSILRNLRLVIVNGTLEFDNETSFCAIEVDYEPMKGMLTTELEAERAPAPQQAPGKALRRRLMLTFLARQSSLRGCYVSVSSHTANIVIQVGENPSC